MQVKKQQLESGMEWQTGSKLGKEYVKAVYCHPAYLTYIQSISCEMPGCMTQAGIKIAERNSNNLRYIDDAIIMAGSEEELKSLLMNVKEESEKVALNSTFKKLRSWHLVPSLHNKLMGQKWKQWKILFSWVPKSLWIVTSAMKLKDTCSLKEKLRQSLTAY